MAKETSEPGPPQPILIQSGSVLPVEESMVVQTDDSTSAQEMKSSSGGLDIAIQRYETLNAQTDPGRALSYIALIFLLGGPILAFTGLEGAMDLEEAFTICCGGIFIGLGLALISLIQTSAYQKEVRLAYDTVKAEANVPTPPANQSHVILAVLLILFGFVVWIFVPELFGIGIIMIAGGVAVASLKNPENNKKFREQVLTQAKLELKQRKGR